MQKLFKRFKDAPKYLIAAVLVIVPLFPKFPLINIPGTYVAVRFEDLLLMFLAIITVIKILPRIKTFLASEVTVAILIFFGVGLVSVLSGALLTQTADFRLGFLHLMRRVEYVVPFFAVLYLLDKDRIGEYLNYYLKILIVVMIVAFIYGYGQRFWHFPIIITQNEEYSKGIALLWTPGSHINSSFAGHYDLAAFCVMLIPVFLAGFFLLKDRLSKIALLIASASGLWLLINSVSRIAQVAYLSAIFVTFILIRKFKALAVTVVVSLIFIGMSASLDARFGRVIQVFYQKINMEKRLNYIRGHFIALADETLIPAKKTESNSAPVATPIPIFEDRSTSIRLNVEWPRALRAFEKNPVIGTGYSSISLATDNDYLRMLGETGILGFAAFWLVVVTIGKILTRFKDIKGKMNGIETAFLSGVIGATAGVFLTALFIDLFEASKFATLYWLFLGLAVVLVRKYTNAEKN